METRFNLINRYSNDAMSLLEVGQSQTKPFAFYFPIAKQPFVLVRL